MSPRNAGSVAVIAGLLLLGCSGKTQSEANGGAGQSQAGGAGSSSPVGGASGTFGGAQATDALAGRASGGAGALGGGANGGTSDATGGVAGSAGGGGSIVSGAGRAGGLGHAGSSGAGSAAGTLLGFACTSDLQCGKGMVCATANGTLFGGAGPSHGMCTASCTPGGTECGTLKAGAECFDFGTDAAPQSYCLDACALGEPADLQTKCAGRFDFACVGLGQAPGTSFCVPHCRSDAECGSDLYCDKSSVLGLCSKTKPPAGDPVGTPCPPGATISTCEGYCLTTSAPGVTPKTGACVELCSGGSECMYSSGSSPSPGGICGGSLIDAVSTIDLGFCLANCSCTGTCKLPGNLCRKWPAEDADLASALGAPGVCYPTLAGSVELTCASGGAGGGG